MGSSVSLGEPINLLNQFHANAYVAISRESDFTPCPPISAAGGQSEKRSLGFQWFHHKHHPTALTKSSLNLARRRLKIVI
jgi:hypothetical protein